MLCTAFSTVSASTRTSDSIVSEDYDSIALLTGLKYSFELIRFFILSEELALAPIAILTNTPCALGHFSRLLEPNLTLLLVPLLT